MIAPRNRCDIFNNRQAGDTLSMHYTGSICFLKYQVFLKTGYNSTLQLVSLFLIDQTADLLNFRYLEPEKLIKAIARSWTCN